MMYSLDTLQWRSKHIHQGQLPPAGRQRLGNLENMTTTEGTL